MGNNEKNRSWGRVLPYLFGGFLCLLTAVAAHAGMPWYLSVIVLSAAIMIMLGQRRIFRPSVTRVAGEIVCRYIPWYEGNAYMVCLVIPALGVAATTAGLDPDNPPWLRYVGIMLISVLPLMLWSAVYVWRRSILRISPSVLTLRSGMVGSKLTEVRRDQIASITPMIVTKGTSKSLQTEIAYHPIASGSGDNEIETVLLGLHLTVKPINLANALIAWDDAAIDDPDELLDLIERVLRSKAVSDVAPPPSRSAVDGNREAPDEDSDYE